MTPSSSEGWLALGAGCFEAAQRAFCRIAPSDPEHGVALLGLALSYWGGGHRFAALGAARWAAAVRPDLVDAHVTLGDMQRRTGDVDGALQSFEAARQLEPGNAVILRQLSDIYRRQLRPLDALSAAKAALELDPASIEGVVCVGDALQANELFSQAAGAYRTALAFDGRAYRAMAGLGRVALMCANWDDARSAFARARAIAPQDPDVRYDSALLDLRFGHYRDAYAALPAVMDSESEGARYYYHANGVPLWDGTPLDGRRLVIASDQGLGDQIMMARYFAQLPQYGTTISVEAPTPVLNLFRRNFPVVRFECFTRWQSPHRMDLHLPVTQLPRIAGIAEESDICGEPYLRADPERVKAVRARLTLEPNVRHIGIVWRGNPQNPRDRWRAAPLRHWTPLAALPDVCFHSLQVDATTAEIAAAPFPIVATHESIVDMDDTAALMAVLDSVISVDTSTVHLAGALGRPTWMPNSLVSDSRWGVDRVDSPWYSTLRIARQTTRDDWTPVFTTIANELHSRVKRIASQISPA